MTADRPNPGDQRVVPLPPRRPGARPPRAGNDNRPVAPARRSAVGDLSPFERDGANHDDYRHRMIVNALAFAFCIFLVLAGMWLVTKIAQMRKDQDCALSGR